MTPYWKGYQEISLLPVTHAGRQVFCKLPIEPGPCWADFERWAVNGTECVKFIYGGCGGNENNFETKEECLGKCRCTFPIDVGPFRVAHHRYGFNGTQCVYFTHGGYRGNANRFGTFEECRGACGGGGPTLVP